MSSRETLFCDDVTCGVDLRGDAVDTPLTILPPVSSTL